MLKKTLKKLIFLNPILAGASPERHISTVLDYILYNFLKLYIKVYGDIKRVSYL